jgi:hypothetical protein
VAIDARAPKFDGGIVDAARLVPLGIVVNRDGERFYDEGEDFWPKRYAIWGKLVARSRTRSRTRSSTRRCATVHAVDVPADRGRERCASSRRSSHLPPPRSSAR